ncbi:hypothetical protein BKA69DRAFT_608127 [Paraphysoderma sedebokerense]|nr:hypothetical protein BKA69DRAFT_608127 [Paraphysoderma sedebokerense]
MDIGSLNIEFQLGEPFKPLEQLMGVLPAASRKHIPEPLRKLMTDPESEIIDFYPERFHIDLNGKKHSWQGVVILPFIEEDRLLKAMEPVYPTLSEGDRKLNTKGREILYVGHHNKLFETFCKLYGKESDSLLPLDPKLSNHMTGFIMQDPAACPPGSLFRSPFPEFGLRDIKNNRSVSASFIHPDVSVSQFIRTLLPSVRMPPKQLGWNDIDYLKNPQRRRRPPHILAEERRDNQQRADRFVRFVTQQLTCCFVFRLEKILILH